eukprot:GHUV01015713.1.p3 GENE.GHUV01015713.1~~GHUV01015713.1.p3  ORF type:complete len:145 (-),score=14.18 GHUV01015713.1:1154-1588(-)
MVPAVQCTGWHSSVRRRINELLVAGAKPLNTWTTMQHCMCTYDSTISSDRTEPSGREGRCRAHAETTMDTHVWDMASTWKCEESSTSPEKQKQHDPALRQLSTSPVHTQNTHSQSIKHRTTQGVQTQGTASSQAVKSGLHQFSP